MEPTCEKVGEPISVLGKEAALCHLYVKTWRRSNKGCWVASRKPITDEHQVLRSSAWSFTNGKYFCESHSSEAHASEAHASEAHSSEA